MKKNFSVLGIVVGGLFVLLGILSIFGAFGGDTSSPVRAPYGYDSGYAEFGADYYTYSSNNAAEAASAARTAAYNAQAIAEFLTLFCGLASILLGLMVICGFGIVLSTSAKTTIDTKSDHSTDLDTLVETSAENI